MSTCETCHTGCACWERMWQDKCRAIAAARDVFEAEVGRLLEERDRLLESNQFLWGRVDELEKLIPMIRCRHADDGTDPCLEADDSGNCRCCGCVEMCTKVEVLTEERDRLRAALEKVEFVGITDYCPWCGNIRSQGHGPDCQRQRALGVAP